MQSLPETGEGGSPSGGFFFDGGGAENSVAGFVFFVR